ncbi:MAG TPA: transposase, partial [Candidatus Competibacteraceae bacterium]|nr:transposase [Candidatus Competibacteraceae bacterium]
MSPFRPIERQTPDLVPPSVADWRPEAPLARFIVEVVAGLDVSRLERTYRGRGRAASHPAWLLSRLVSGYATGVCSSRRSERATDESLACRFLAAGRHPDPDPLAAFRRRCLAEWADRFL